MDPSSKGPIEGPDAPPAIPETGSQERLTLGSLQGLDGGYERTSMERLGSNDLGTDDDRASCVSSLSSTYLDRPQSPTSLREAEVAEDSTSFGSRYRGSSSSMTSMILPAAVEAYNNIFDGGLFSPESDNIVDLDKDANTCSGVIQTFSESRGMMPGVFQRMRLAQTIDAHDGAIYALKFSPDGKYLATAGEDGKIVVWVVGQLQNFEDDGEESPSPSVSGNTSDSRSRNSATPGGGHGSDQGGSGGGGSGGGDDTCIHSGSGSGSGELDPNSSIASSDREGSDAQDLLDCNIVICPSPYRVYSGHDESVLDVAWSGSSFLLSASADMCVRLWRLEDRAKSLKLFKHDDIVTSVDFHPTNDTLFVSGCFDGKVTLWDNIQGNLHDFSKNKDAAVTSVSFAPDGTQFIAGLKDGHIQTYGVKFSADKIQIVKGATESLRDRGGKYADGRKVTGIVFDPAFSSIASSPSTLRYCVTTNDSNIRLVESVNSAFNYTCKFKGGKNSNLQIKATFSEDGKYIICSTENGKVLVWESDTESVDTSCASRLGTKKPLPGVRRNESYEWFQCTGKNYDARGKKMSVPCTSAIFAPAAAVHRLLESAVEIQRRTLSKRFEAMTSSSSPEKASSTSTNAPESTRTVLPEDWELSTSLIATADCDGRLRLWIRKIVSE